MYLYECTLGRREAALVRDLRQVVPRVVLPHAAHAHAHGRAPLRLPALQQEVHPSPPPLSLARSLFIYISAPKYDSIFF